MLRVIQGALRARRTQTVIVLVLTALAVGVAAAAPWYVGAAAREVAAADVSGAPASQLVARASGRLEGPGREGTITPDALLDRVRTGGRNALNVPGARTTAAIREGGTLTTGAARVTLPIAYRDRLCDNVVLEGECPAAAGDILLSDRTAELLQVGAGDRVDYVSSVVGGRPMRVVGTYQLAEPLGPYWAGTPLGGSPGLDPSSEGSGDPAFTTVDTFASLPLREYTTEFHVVVPQSMFVDDAEGLAALLDREARTADTWRVETTADTLADRIVRERRLLNLGVAVAASQLLLLCWFGLFFAVRHTAEQRRPDLGLLKLRGAARWRMWTLASGQSGVPILIGAVLGAAAGVALARLAAGEVGPADATRRAVILSAVAGAAALAGALVSAVAADVRGMRAGVTDLLRHVPARRRGWRADVVDVLLVLVAAAGLYQAQATRGARETGGLALLAPALVALVVALVAARALTPLAGLIGDRALRSGRVPVALGATQLSRRPGTHRVFALLVVAVALLGTAVGGWSASADARAERAVHELGADRVLTVQARSRGHLLAAVRAADPQGRAAMAVVHGESGVAEVTLAVDSARFAAVTNWPGRYGEPGPPAIAGLLRPPSAAIVRVPDGPVTLDASAAGGEDPVHVQLLLRTADGDARTLRFGPVTASRTTLTARADGCGAPGCRLVAFEVVGTDRSGRRVAPRDGRSVTLYALGGAGSILDGAAFGDIARWRTGVGALTSAPRIAASTDALTVTAVEAAAGKDRSTEVYPVDAPVPLPVVRTGDPPRIGSGDRRLRLFGGDPVPVRHVAVTPTMPRVPANGYLVDLEYADRVAAGSGLGDVPEVWLAADAPADIVDRLTAQGLTIVDDETVAGAADRLNREGPPAALRFQVIAGLIGLLLAAGAFTVVATVERPERAAELGALRVQGLPPRAVRAVAYGGYAGLALAAVLLGAAASALAQAVTRRPVPLFIDGWGVLPVAIGPQPLPMLAALAVGVLVAGAAGVAAAARLVRAIRGGPA